MRDYCWEGRRPDKSQLSDRLHRIHRWLFFLQKSAVFMWPHKLSLQLNCFPHCSQDITFVDHWGEGRRPDRSQLSDGSLRIPMFPQTMYDDAEVSADADAEADDDADVDNDVDDDVDADPHVS